VVGRVSLSRDEEVQERRRVVQRSMIRVMFKGTSRADDEASAYDGSSRAFNLFTNCSSSDKHLCSYTITLSPKSCPTSRNGRRQKLAAYTAMQTQEARHPPTCLILYDAPAGDAEAEGGPRPYPTHREGSYHDTPPRASPARGHSPQWPGGADPPPTREDASP
jgi:hypothetical protein